MSAEAFLPGLRALPQPEGVSAVDAAVRAAIREPDPGDPFGWLDMALDPGLQRPKLAPDIEISHHTTRWGGGYAVVRNPRGPVYLRLAAEDGRLMERFDGERTVRELVVEELQDTASLDVTSATELVAVLESSGFLEDPWSETYELIKTRILPARSRAAAAARRFARSQTVHFPKAREMSEWGYRWGGRFLFRWYGQVALTLLLVAGLVALWANVAGDRFRIVGDSLAVGFGLLFLFDLLATMIHEAGHALAIRHAKRDVITAGFQLYLGHPAFFIDSADILMSPMRDRIRNAWYGPYLSLVVAGTASIAAFLLPHTGFGTTMFRLSILTYLTAVLNLIPFLELDGYWIMVDALETPDLRPRSLSFLRHELPRKIRRREALTRQEWGLTGFGLVGTVFTILALWTSVYIWGPVFQTFATAMWRHGPPTRVLLVLLFGFILGPLVAGIWQGVRTVWAQIRYLWRRLLFQTELGWRREAGELIAEMPVLDELPLEVVNALAGKVRLVRFAEGRTVFREGDRADAFYVVRNGRFAVVDESAGGVELRTLTRGDSFGEIALLQGTPRTATVRASRPSEAFAVDRSSFQTWLADSVNAEGLMGSATQLAEVRSLAPFRHLSAADAESLREAGSWMQVAPGEVVVRQGEPGEHFYAVASGQLEVDKDGEIVATIKAGGFFGELALLKDAPRAATVRAITAARLFRLDRRSFDQLVAGAFHRGIVRVEVHADRVVGRS
ncbi:MAG: cyclic nucleotide-binding domain-containing protein [Actinobacteria bacterium]|nr:cyclic nucleotide-binding domain-containing protein [Actinomycetota bacterium]